MKMIPIVVTLVGIVTDVSPEHDMKALLPYRVRVSINAGNKLITVAMIPIEITLVGIITDVSDVHPRKAS